MEEGYRALSYTIKLVLKKQDGDAILNLSHAIKSFKKLYSEVSYILNGRREELRINFKCHDLNFSFEIESSSNDFVHTSMEENLHITFYDKKKMRELLYHPSIRYLFKDLFKTLLNLEISSIIISFPDRDVNLNEEIIRQYANKVDNYKGCRMSIDILNGMSYLKDIFSKIEQTVTDAGTQDQFYENPLFIFRGITRFYPGDDYVKKEIKRLKKGKEDYKLSLDEELPWVKKDVIKSSLSVRLRDTSRGLGQNDAYIRSHYVNALEEMIYKAQNMFPTKYTAEMSDLDILADLQHNGGSTCLVDFSKNILTSIWFSCNTDREYNGYLYCYNVMEDMIKNDALTNIRPEDEKMKIAELLAQTYKETNVCSDVETRFCLWEPSKKNNRLFRQDSVFIFGIEKFEVPKHSIKVIGIKAEWKLPILTALKAVYNISGSTVYNDYVGFANNTNKLRPYRKMGDTAYTRGYMNMIKGNYSSALDFLKLSEVDTYNREFWDEKKKLELHFSLGVCYKGLARQEGKIHYYENALWEYGKVIHAAQYLVHENNKNYYMHKAIRAYNARITLLYKLARYGEAIEECKKIKDDIDNGWLRFYKEKNAKLTSKYCNVSILELQALKLLSKKKDDRKVSESLKQIDGLKLLHQYKKECAQIEKIDFFRLLEEYYTYIPIILKVNDVSYEKLKNEVCEIIDRWNYIATFKSSMEKNTNDYILWNLTDIKNVIDSINDDFYFFDKKSILQDLTAGVISLRDAFQMYGWWSKTNI